MNWSFRNLIFTLILSSTLVSLALGSLLIQWYRQIDLDSSSVAENSLIGKELDFLSIGIDQALTNGDLLFGANQAYLAEGLIEELRQVRHSVAELEEFSHLDPSRDHLRNIDNHLVAIEGLASHFLVPSDAPNAPDAPEEFLERFDAHSLAMIVDLNELTRQSTIDASAMRDQLTEKRSLLHLLTWLIAGLYLVFNVTLFSLVALKMINPIEKLAATAREAMETGQPFDLKAEGPAEVKRLTETISIFVSGLEAQVKLRTSGLTEQSKELRRQIQKQLLFEKELIQSKQEADSANQAKSDFIAKVSHEIRTPMNGILGFAELMEGTDLDPQQKRFCRLINSCGETLLFLINDVLDISKIESGKTYLESSGFDLYDCVNDSFSIVAPKAHEKALGYELFFPESARAIVIGDKIRLRQVLLNLLSNAVKFTTQGQVTCSLEKLPSKDRKLRIRFSVTDTGLGIAREGIEKIFNPFHQEDYPEGNAPEGTGLGLTIAQRLVDLMGGEIQVSSRLGEGSTFSFEISLPRVPVHRALTPRQETTSIDCGQVEIEAKLALSHSLEPLAEELPLTILVAEDNEINWQLIEHFLNQLGYQADRVTDGIAVLRATEAKAYDIVLLDLDIPLLNGIQVAEKLRDEPRNHHGNLELIATTASCLESDRYRYRCRDAGIQGFLPKPLDPSRLESELRDAHSRITNQLTRISSTSRRPTAAQ